MKIPKFIQKMWPFGNVEGSWRGPFGGVDATLGGGWHQLDAVEHPFQRNLSIGGRAAIAAVQAAVSKYSDAMVAMPIKQMRRMDGALETIEQSAFLRFARRPNAWQTFAEFMGQGDRALMETGNAVGLMTRNDRTEVTSIVWANHWAVHVDPVSGAHFYTLSMPSLYGQRDDAVLVPGRDVLHLRINVDTRLGALRGRSPLEWCASALATNSTLSAFLVSYLNNRASPSYGLATDMSLSADQMRQLRIHWNEQAKQLASGGTPILANGLKPVQLGVAPGDALLVETFNLSVEDVARAFGLPKSFLGIDETASNSANLIREWMALGLGAHVELWEQAFERAFEMAPNESVEFDATVLLRLDPQVEATRLKELVTGSIMSSDEARDVLGMKPISGGYGKVPAAQQQMVPLDLLHEIHAAAIAAKMQPAQPVQPVPATEPEPAPEPEKSYDPEVLKALVAQTIAKAKAHA